MEQQLSSPQQPNITGVFSREETQKMGSGFSMRKVTRKTYWFCKEQSDGSYEAQPLGGNYIPAGPVVSLERDEFLKLYMPEPEMYLSLVYPSMLELNQTLDRGDRYRTIKKYDKAEKEYGKALWIDEENIRATFGLALTYLGMGNTEKAKQVFERLVALDGAFHPEHKHLFNEFGIKLRKNNLYKHAITYYSRALELTTDDENLFFNLARVHFEREDQDDSLIYSIKAVELNPALEPAVKLLRWILIKKLASEQKLKEGNAFLGRMGLLLQVPASLLEGEPDSPFDDDPDDFPCPPGAYALEMPPELARQFEARQKAERERLEADMTQRVNRLEAEMSERLQARIAKLEALLAASEDALEQQLEQNRRLQVQAQAPAQTVAQAPDQNKTDTLRRGKRMSGVSLTRKAHT